MADVKMVFTADEAKAVNAILNVIKKNKEAANSVEDVNKKHKDQKSTLERATSSLKQMVAGYATLSTAVQAVNELYEAEKRLRDLRSGRAETAADVQIKMTKLAQQLGYEGDEGALKALRRAEDIASYGGIDLEKGAAITQSVYGNIKTDDKTNLFISRMLSATAGKGQLSAEETGVLAELIEAAGAGRTEEDATQLMAQAEAGLLASAALGFGKYSQSAIKGGMGMLIKGGQATEMFARIAQTRAVSGGSDDVAAEMMKQLLAVIESDEGRAILKDAGAESASINEQIDALGKAVKDPSKAGMLDKVPTEKRAVLQKVFSDAAQRAYEQATNDIANADVAKYRSSLDKSRNTLAAKMQVQDNRAMAEQARAGFHDRDRALAERQAQLDMQNNPFEEMETSSFYRGLAAVNKVIPVQSTIYRMATESDDRSRRTDASIGREGHAGTSQVIQYNTYNELPRAATPAQTNPNAPQGN